MFRCLFRHMITAFLKKNAAATRRILAIHSRQSTSLLMNSSRLKEIMYSRAAAVQLTGAPFLTHKLHKKIPLQRRGICYYYQNKTNRVLICGKQVRTLYYYAYTFSNLAKLAISFFVPALSKATSRRLSLPIGLTERITPVPKVLCLTVSPTLYVTPVLPEETPT